MGQTSRRGFWNLRIIWRVMGLLALLVALGWFAGMTTSRVDVTIINRFLQTHAASLLLGRVLCYTALLTLLPRVLPSWIQGRGGRCPSRQAMDRFRWQLAGFIGIFELFIVQNLVGRMVQFI